MSTYLVIWGPSKRWVRTEQNTIKKFCTLQYWPEPSFWLCHPCHQLNHHECREWLVWLIMPFWGGPSGYESDAVYHMWDRTPVMLVLWRTWAEWFGQNCQFSSIEAWWCQAGGCFISIALEHRGVVPQHTIPVIVMSDWPAHVCLLLDATIWGSIVDCSICSLVKIGLEPRWLSMPLKTTSRCRTGMGLTLPWAGCDLFWAAGYLNADPLQHVLAYDGPCVVVLHPSWGV